MATAPIIPGPATPPQPGAPLAPKPGLDATSDNPQKETGEQAAAAQQLDPTLQAALFEIRSRFKMRYQPKRTIFVNETMRAFQALRGNTYALLNDQGSALSSISQLMDGLVGAGDDPSLHDHNDNIYQMFGLSFIAALMVNLGKVRYQPADADDEEDLEIAKKASTIQAYNERKNDEEALKQLQLLYLWTSGSYFRYVRYVIDKERAGTSMEPDIQTQKTRISEDGHICPACAKFTPDSSQGLFSVKTRCASCGCQLTQKDWFEGQFLDLPVQVGEIEVANGMTAFDIVSGLMVDVNPDAQELKDSEILDYSIDCSAAKVRAAYPTMYESISPSQGTDAASDGDAARTARNLTTTPGSNQKPVTTEGLVTYSRCWITKDAFFELENKDLAMQLVEKFPKGCKLSLCGTDTFLDAVNESMVDHWTWCGTIKGLGMYPFAAGKVCLDVQERITDVVNIEHAYLSRLAFGTILYDADFVDGNALATRGLTPGNMTPVSRTDEETGISKPLSDLMYQPSFHVDSEIFRQTERLTARAQLLAGIMPQIFGGSDPNVQTKGGQEQALNTALGRLKQYVNQMRGENARCARISVRCSIDNMDEEIKIVEEGEMQNSYQTIRLLKAQLNGEFFTYPETAEGFPASYEQIQSRVMQLLAENQKSPFVGAILSDPDNAAQVARYVLPDQITLPNDEQRAKIKKVLNRLSQGKATVIPGPTGAPVTMPSILPEPGVDDPGICQTLAKKWLLKNYDQHDTNPAGYANILAYLKICAQLAQEQAAKAALTMQAQQAQAKSGGAQQAA